MNRKRWLFVILMTVFVCLNPVPAIAQCWDGWWGYDSYEYEYFSYEEYCDPSPSVYYYQPAPIVIGIGGCGHEYDD